MPIPFLSSIGLNKNEVQDFKVFNLASDPTLTASGDLGYLWLNTTNAGGVIPTLKWWDGTNVRSLVDSTNIGSFTAGLATDLAGGGAGQVVYQDGANDTKFLAAGTAGQVLSSNAASAPSWLNQSSLAAGTAANISGGLAGQLLYQSGLATTAKLTIGTAGQALVVNSGATAPEWVDQSTLSVGSATNKPGGTVGDILVQSGSGSTGFLNAGTNGQVITSNGLSPQYVNQSTLSVGSATTSGTATNIAGGAANRIPYQTAAGTTSFITDAANAILTTNASSVPSLKASIDVTVGKAVDIALGAAGDLLYQSASNDTSFLNIGANGSILTSTGTAPQWSASIPSGSVSGLAASATTDTTNASNISSGTLGLARLSLATGQFYVGDGSNNPAATLKSSIPLSGFGAAGANVAMGSFKITGLADPESGTDAANKNYVDSVAQGLDVKASCKVGTIANITLSGPGSSIDGISLSVDDRVLVKDQTDKKENGIYLFKGAAVAMERSSDANTVAKLTSAFTFVEQGTNADSGWVCTVDSGTIGSVDIEWLKFSQAGSYTQGRGMVLDGTAFNFAQSTNYTANTIPYASGATTIGFIGAGTADQVLRVPGAGGTPAFGAIDLSKSAAVTGTLAVGNGGTGAATFTAGRVLFGNGTSALNTSANLFWDNSNNRLGIGTATPRFSLDATGDIAIPLNSKVYAYYVTATNYASFGANNSGNIEFTTGTSSPAVRQTIAADGVCTWSNVGGVAGTAMTLNGTGLGIGESPSAKLHVYTAGNNVAQLKCGSTTDGHTNRLAFINASGAADARTGVIEWYDVGTFKGDFRFLKAGGIQIRNSADSVTFTLEDGGNVGIGTTSSVTRLHVVDNSTNVQARFASSNNNGTSIQFYNTGTGGRNWQIGSGFAVTAGNFEFYDVTAGANRLSIKSTGQVNFVGLASDPTGAAGDVVYNSTSNRLKYHNGTAWVDSGTRKYVVQLSDASVTVAGNAYTLTHNFASKDVTISIRRTTDDAVVLADVTMPTTNTATVTFAAAITAANYYVTVIG